ncbi:MAG: aspartyl/asparaginyl beta-hydroxylase domain-containing protein, partial [Rhodomicrobium sp.]
MPRFQELMPEQTEISANDGRDWRMFILKAYGIEVSQNMAACPALAGLIRQTPEVISAALSFLAPRKHIPPHYGPFKGILRFHLILSMPTGSDGKPAVVLKIDDAEHRLADGECLLWDDTY